MPVIRCVYVSDLLIGCVSARCRMAAKLQKARVRLADQVLDGKLLRSLLLRPRGVGRCEIRVLMSSLRGRFERG
jgi:hypothetical protein